MITADPILAMKRNRGATYWPQNLRYLLETHGMNYWKFLCLQWQSSTGKPCKKTGHTGQEGSYKNKLECEAQLVESLVEASRCSQALCRDIKPVLIETHADMGCSCDWQPKLKPPLKELDK